MRRAARLGPLWGLAALGFRRRRDVDAFYATGEDVGIPFALMMRAVNDLGRITLVAHHANTLVRRALLRGLGHAVWRDVIVLASRQREILTREIGYPPEKVHCFELWLDARFYRPQSEEPGAYVFSCGRESRDYAMLLSAAAGSPGRFRVVASGWAAQATFGADSTIVSTPNFDVQSNISYEELRAAYAGARFVVVPLARVDYAAGVTAICEGMAMGKAIVTTDSPGIRDYVRDGVSGLVVRAGDAPALKRAIAELWDDPQRCATMAAHNRAWIESSMSIERYVERVAGLFGAAP